MSPDDIQAEYVRLGYRLGWTFMMTPEARLHDGRVCLVGLNPGGSHDGVGTWSCEEGNAYHTQRWRPSGDEGSYSPLQVQVHFLEALLGLEEAEYFAAQFIPFRSADWRRLCNADQALAFGQRLWAWVLGRSPAQLFLCLGNKAAMGIGGLIGAGDEERHPTGWGATTIGRRIGAGNRVVVRLPHLSRYGLFGRSGDLSAVAVASLKVACRPAP